MQISYAAIWRSAVPIQKKQGRIYRYRQQALKAKIRDRRYGKRAFQTLHRLLPELKQIQANVLSEQGHHRLREI